MVNYRIKVPKTVKAGNAVEIRAMVMHPMENGFRTDSQGTVIPAHIITDFVCTYDGDTVFSVKLEPGISANPYFSFYLKATKSGPVNFLWTDQDGTATTGSAELEVT